MSFCYGRKRNRSWIRSRGTQILLSASDLSIHPGCPHFTQLDLQVAEGTPTRFHRSDPRLHVSLQLAEEQERAYLDDLSEKLVSRALRLDESGSENAARETERLLPQGVPALSSLRNGIPSFYMR